HYYYWTSIDTVYLTNSPAFMNKLPEVYVFGDQALTYYLFPSDTSYCFNGYSLKSNATFVFETCDDIATHKFGLGAVDSDFCQLPSPFCSGAIGPTATTYRHLVYYKKGGLSCGQPVNPNPSTVSNLSLKNLNFIFSPNPSNNILTITASNPGAIYKASVINMFGQTVKVFQPFIYQGSIDISNLSAGIYNVCIITETGVEKNERVVVIH
ncbi:MAG: T9SS type A sorting domain-containing protein, partial [Chitinophagales bacterium]